VSVTAMAASDTDADIKGEGFSGSRARFEDLVDWLNGAEADRLEHAELEDQLQTQGRDLLRRLLQDHLNIRAEREHRVVVSDADQTSHTAVETGHTRRLGTVFGEVTVSRLAYRRRGHHNLYPADAWLNLPTERHSHGLRRLIAAEAARGSYDAARDALVRATGQQLGKRQAEQLAIRAAADFTSFYATRGQPSAQAGDLVVISVDGKGVVMRPDALRPATAKAAAATDPKLATRLSKGEKRNRKRMAEVGAVYHVTPVARTVADVLPDGEEQHSARAAPKATGKWLTASVVDDAASVIAAVFDEACRRDPTHARTWVALVDGNNHQIDTITRQARARGVEVAVVVDLVHVLEYLWKAAWCFHNEGDPDAETWVHDKARAVLAGHATRVAAAIRRKATYHQLTGSARASADKTADYLTRKAEYLDYPTALEQGWPIATGVIEGACRQLVKDRMDITGARWGLHGAEAVLQLRALTSNHDFDDYWTYHLAQEQRRVHQSRYANATVPTAA